MIRGNLRKRKTSTLNKKVKNATPTGIYKSRLEANCAKLLSQNGLYAEYEPDTYTLQKSVSLNIEFINFAVKRQQKTLLAIKHTPDFFLEHKGHKYIIECKGLATKDYEIKKKMFLMMINNIPNISYFVVHNISEINRMINLIKGRQRD